MSIVNMELASSPIIGYLLRPMFFALATVTSTRSSFSKMIRGRKSSARAYVLHDIIRKHWAMPHASIWINNHASQFMDANVNHFTNLQCPEQKVVTKGITDGLIIIKAFGTVHWNITDDQGWIHHIAIDDSSLVPDLPHALLSPKHWIQQENDHFPKPHGTIMEQYLHDSKLYWGQKKIVTTIPLDPK